MNLARLIVIALVIWLALSMMRRFFKKPSSPSPDVTAKDTVRCAQCGLHLPKAEAISDQGQHYCCQEHRRQHGRSS